MVCSLSATYAFKLYVDSCTLAQSAHKCPCTILHTSTGMLALLLLDNLYMLAGFQNNLTPHFINMTFHKRHPVADLKRNASLKKLACNKTRCRFLLEERLKYLYYFLF